MTDPLLLLRTVRHLRPVQVTNRVWRRLVPAEAVGAAARRAVRGRWAFRGAGRAVPPIGLSGDTCSGRRYRLINEERVLDGENRWRPDGAGRLWVYHLHGFEWLHSCPAPEAREQVLDWIRENRPMATAGWEPYPISIRLRVWLEWLAGAYGELPESERRAVLESLALQAEVLHRTVEHHLQANHLLENAISLVWAGLRLDGSRSGAWLRRGVGLLGRELGRQILGDGVHEERSPAYHGMVCHALVRLVEVGAVAGTAAGRDVSGLCRPMVERMLGAWQDLVHPDGGVTLMNDSGLGWAPPVEDAASRAGVVFRDAVGGAWARPDAGYFGWRRGDDALVFDAGPVGPDHQPGHAHADALSFELSLGGRRVVTDTGVMTYEPGAVRAWDRGTAAHNTVQVGGADQCELWAAFRCGRRPSVTGTTSAVPGEPGSVTFRGTAAVKTMATGTYRHRRTISVRPGRIIMSDRVVSRRVGSMAMRVHLAPGIEVRLGSGKRRANLYVEDRRIATVEVDTLGWRVEATPYHPDFNIEHERACLVLQIGDVREASWSWRILWTETA